MCIVWEGQNSSKVTIDALWKIKDNVKRWINL